MLVRVAFDGRPGAPRAEAPGGYREGEQTRKEKTEAVETLHAVIDQLKASFAKLTEEIAGSGAGLWLMLRRMQTQKEKTEGAKRATAISSPSM